MKSIILQNERGFTLIEVLVALAVLAISLVAIMDGLAMANRNNADIYRYNTALSLAQSKMEEIKDSPFISVVDIAPVDFTEESEYSGFTGFLYSVEVTDNNMINKTVIVTVFYHDGGILKEVALTGEVTRR